jgi:uncharacterized protein (UPF0248 family)
MTKIEVTLVFEAETDPDKYTKSFVDIDRMHARTNAMDFVRRAVDLGVWVTEDTYIPGHQIVSANLQER